MSQRRYILVTYTGSGDNLRRSEPLARQEMSEALRDARQLGLLLDVRRAKKVQQVARDGLT